MNHTGVFSHRVEIKNEYFTGSSPALRLQYVQGSRLDVDYSGENCAWSSKISTYGKTEEEIAYTIAHNALEQWKLSPGHNKNMLSKQHELEGTAFVITESSYYGTTQFGITHNPSVYVGDKESEISKLSVIQPSKLAKNIKTHISNRIIAKNSDMKADEILAKASMIQATYMQANRTEESIQQRAYKNFYATTPEKRYKKIEHGFFSFADLKPVALKEFCVLYYFNELDFSFEPWIETTWEDISKGINSSWNNFSRYGVSVKVKRKNQNIEVFITVLLQE